MRVADAVPRCRNGHSTIRMTLPILEGNPPECLSGKEDPLDSRMLGAESDVGHMPVVGVTFWGRWGS